MQRQINELSKSSKLHESQISELTVANQSLQKMQNLLQRQTQKELKKHEEIFNSAADTAA